MTMALKREPQSPLDTLNATLHTQMQAVNSLILDEIGTDVPDIQEVARYLIDSGGKRIRPLLTLSCASLIAQDIQPSYPLAAAVEFIHSATLLHDDVVDDSQTRRGKDTANIVHGNPTVVLVGDFLFSRAFQLMVSCGDLGILKSLSDASATIAEGEVLQLSHIGDVDMHLDVYEQIIGAKTAVLFASACEVGALSVGGDATIAQSLYDYGYHLGLAFQMADDLLDYGPGRGVIGKDAGDDFREGKPTLPVLLARDTDPEFWQRCIKDGDQNEGDFDHARALINQCGAREKAQHMARNHAQTAILNLSTLPPSPIKDTLSNLAEFVITRGH